MNTVSSKMFETRNDLESDIRQKSIDILNAQLADTFDMFSLIKQAHWNVKGPNFISLHELFDELADGLREHIDTIAERITALGGTAKGTVKMAADASRLATYPEDLFNDMETVKFLADQMANLADSTRAAADLAEETHDMATNDLFIEVVRDLDKWLWFLEAHIQA